MSSLIVLLALSTRAYALDIHVPADQPTLAAAITAARPVDTIVLDTSITEDVVINNKVINIEGPVPSSTLTALTGSITLVNGADLSVTDLTLRGGVEETDFLEISLGNFCTSISPGITADGSSVTLDNVDLLCFDTALFADNSDVTATASTFRFNYNSAFVARSSQVNVDTTTFELNTGYLGGAVMLEGIGSDAHIETSRFITNTSSGGYGGAIYSEVDNLELWANELNNNYNLLYFSPGISLAEAIALGIDISGIIVGLGEGGGAYVAPGSNTVDIWNNTFCGNLADTGAGLYVDNVEGVGITNNRFAENWSLHYGGGLYVEAEEPWADPARVVNNTFLFNTAGMLPPPNPDIIVAIGAGGAAAFVNTVADFRNNIVAFTQFGAGLLGVAQDLGVSIDDQPDPDFTIGDLLTVTYNDFFFNCDVRGCQAAESVHFSGDLSQISLSQTNIELDPFPTYFGGGEFNCFPDAFYPEYDSPVVGSGDITEPNRYNPPQGTFSDMGAYGGPNADVLDRDGDGYANIYDCNDEAATGALVHPGAPEVCDLMDNDCNGQIDEGHETTWYPDSDGDGFGDTDVIQAEINCSPPPNKVLNRLDCDDDDSAVNPESTELCDGIDNDCDGSADGGLSFLSLWQDRDLDLYGAGAQVNGCLAQDANAGPGVYYVQDPLTGDQELQVGGYVDNGRDCNDFDIAIHPGAPEVCDDVDNDCDGEIDNSSQGGVTYYLDDDGDGFGSDDEDNQVVQCSPPTSGAYVTEGGDCQDDNPDVNPGEAEVCDSVDNDCNGKADQNAIDGPVFFQDLDGDGHGNPAFVSTDCVAPAGYTATVGDDCNDADDLSAFGKCEATCGCQAAPTSGSVGSLGALLGLAIVGLRRRNR